MLTLLEEIKICDFHASLTIGKGLRGGFSKNKFLSGNETFSSSMTDIEIHCLSLEGLYSMTANNRKRDFLLDLISGYNNF